MRSVVGSVDCLVIGAGVVGLAAARALAQAGFDTVVVEAAAAIGTGISARNSEVVHAGLYYPRGSLKARLCVRGREWLYEYCARRGLAHRRCGKLIVATDTAQIGALEALLAAARANGVDDVAPLDGDAARRLEPALHCQAALHSPSTGIVDAHALMLALLGDAEDAGATLACNSPVARLLPGAGGFRLFLPSEREPVLRTRWVVNGAGLSATAVAERIEGFPREHVPAVRYAKGSYFAPGGRAPFSRLIYPVPEPGGLGVHLTLDLAGQARFGPDVEWVERPDYAVDPARAAAFAERVRRFWPGLGDRVLQPAYVGVRPKLSGPGEPAADFRIDGPADHGVDGVVNLFGIESPGLTAALAIAGHVLRIVQDGAISAPPRHSAPS